VERQEDSEDGRGRLMRLTAKGKALYSKIVPMVQAREEFLLSALDATERAVLDGALTKLLDQARQLIRTG
jgi:DNA-binding MarR family transcriptional regulator